MSDIDILLALAFALQNYPKPNALREAIKRLIKRAPGHRRPALGMFLKSRDPRAMIVTLLNNWESIPDEDIDAARARGEAVGDSDAHELQHGQVRAPAAELGELRPPVAPGAATLHTDRAPTVGRDPKTGRFYSLVRKPS